MPELPEVQTIVNDLNASGVVGRTIGTVAVFWPKTIANISGPSFCKRLRGKKIDRIYRRAKYIVFQLDDQMHIIVHLRMTGRFLLDRTNGDTGRHVHVSITLDDRRRLLFHDTRKFGRFYLVPDPLSILGSLGPEPLSSNFTSAILWNLFQGRQRQIKPLLLDQHFLAGLGNIYVDEALWTARIHPQKTADQMTYKEVKTLFRAIRLVLRRGLENAGTSLGKGKNNFSSIQEREGTNKNHLKVFRRTGQSCPRCRTSIDRITVGQRSTHICRICQPLSRDAAFRRRGLR